MYRPNIGRRWFIQGGVCRGVYTRGVLDTGGQGLIQRDLHKGRLGHWGTGAYTEGPTQGEAWTLGDRGLYRGTYIRGDLDPVGRGDGGLYRRTYTRGDLDTRALGDKDLYRGTYTMGDLDTRGRGDGGLYRGTYKRGVLDTRGRGDGGTGAYTKGPIKGASWTLVGAGAYTEGPI